MIVSDRCDPDALVRVHGDARVILESGTDTGVEVTRPAVEAIPEPLPSRSVFGRHSAAQRGGGRAVVGVRGRGYWFDDRRRRSVEVHRVRASDHGRRRATGRGAVGRASWRTIAAKVDTRRNG